MSVSKVSAYDGGFNRERETLLLSLLSSLCLLCCYVVGGYCMSSSHTLSGLILYEWNGYCIATQNKTNRIVGCDDASASVVR